MEPIQLEAASLVALIGVLEILALFLKDWLIDACDGVTHQTHTHHFTVTGIYKHFTQTPSNEILSEIAPPFLDRTPSEDSGFKVQVELFGWNEVHQVNANTLTWEHIP
jgi:hypothetical protein